MDIKEIVFPIDLSERSVEACPYVAALTRRFGAKLTLLHVVESLPHGSSALDRLHTVDEAEMQRLKEEANAALLAFQEQHIKGVASEVCVQVGDPATSIVLYGGENRERMIVMPTRGFGPFRQMLLGSVTAKVLHDANCPVLTGPHLEKAIPPDAWLKLERIMCAVALDWETDEILKASAEFANQLGAQLIATHVVTPVEEGLLPLFGPTIPPISTEPVASAVRDALDRTGVTAQVGILVGEVSRQIARAATEYKADVVVIGKGGGPELAGRFGRHGYAIVRRAPCPVLCI